MHERLTVATTLPDDAAMAALAGRVWRPDQGGPSVVAIRNGDCVDITAVAATMRDLCERPDAADITRQAPGQSLGRLDAILANTPEATRDAKKPWLLAPVDLQAIKAAGVTFARSMLERVIEEQAKGAPEKAEAIRGQVEKLLGGDLRKLKPGSAQALSLKQTLIEQGAWSQYLEVGIGEDAEIFTKAQPMSAVGHGMEAGLHPRSTWNNPEPEVVLVVTSKGKIAGATLGNDVNLRDFEGRSALLLGRGKDNNASCALGPFIRLLDSDFGIEDLRSCAITIEVHGDDGFALHGASDLRKISRDMLDLVSQAINRHHQYPDGLMLFLGTMFAPTQDRGQPGQGFTHHLGDVVTIHTSRLGTLENRVDHTDKIAPWTFGVAELIANLAQRNLLS